MLGNITYFFVIRCFCSQYALEELTIRVSNSLPDALSQGSHRLEKYLNLEGFLEKSLKIKSTLKGTGKSHKSLEKSLNSTIFCKT